MSALSEVEPNLPIEKQMSKHVSRKSLVNLFFSIYSTCTERRSASETAVEFAPLSF